MKQPLVSIIIPVYNVEQYVHQCLSSVVNQTYRNIEVIVVNDGSPDNSLSIIEKLQEKDKRIKIVNKLNEGISAARNSGIEHALGEYIMFVDSDDWVALNIIEKLWSYMPDTDLAACSYNRFYQSNVVPRVFDVEGKLTAAGFKRRLIGLTKDELKDPSQLDSVVTVWGKMYKTDIIKKNHLKFVSTKEIGTCEDLLFNLDYIHFCNDVVVINEPLYNYRKVNLGSFTSLYRNNLFGMWGNLFTKIKRHVTNMQSEQNAFNNRIALSIIGLGLNEIRNPVSFAIKYRNIRSILAQANYKRAYAELELHFLPLHWRLFFILARYRCTIGVYTMLLGINYFVNKNN